MPILVYGATVSECVLDSWDTCLLHGPSQLLNTGGLAVLQSLHTLMPSVHLSEMICLVCYVFHSLHPTAKFTVAAGNGRYTREGGLMAKL